MKKLIIITTHPIQYNAPLFKLLAERKNIGLKVLYTWGQANAAVFDPGFGKVRAWDIPLLEGYDYSFLENRSKDPGSHHFNGIDNPDIIKTIESYDPDSILVYGWSFKSHLKVLRHFKGKKKILFRGDSTLLDESPGLSAKKILRRIFLKWVYRHVDKAMYVGSANRDYFMRHGLPEDKLVFAPHAIDNNRFMEERADMRSLLNIPGEGIVFLFAGKLEDKKAPLHLLESFRELDQERAYLVIAGNGKLEMELKEKVASLPLVIRNRVHFIGFQNQAAMPSVYKTADVFVLPSVGPGETWGLSVNEAMASGKAILVSDKCGCYLDLVEDDINGFVFPAGQRATLTEKMRKLVAEKDKLPVMGATSLNMIKSWSFETICEAIEKEMTNE